ncbi:hypothetical protein [Phenylobacterium sp.]|nr:hypothetical protein [Phenylobacterium sp.]HVI30591.1 hypothetical protein [Phenylobacterium sp.]
MTAALKTDQRRETSHHARPGVRVEVKAAHEVIGKRYPKILTKLAE